MNDQFFKVGDAVRVKADAHTEFAGREGWVRADGEHGGYYVRIGTADWLWFGDDEIEPR